MNLNQREPGLLMHCRMEILGNAVVEALLHALGSFVDALASFLFT